MEIEKNTIDFKTYIEYVYGSYSEALDESGEYKKYKKYYERLKRGERPFNIWALIFSTSWLSYRRIYKEAFLVTALGYLLLISLYFPVFLLTNSTILADIPNLIGFIGFGFYCGIFGVSRHWKFLNSPKATKIKKGPSVFMAIVFPLISGVTIALPFILGALILGVIDN